MSVTYELLDLPRPKPVKMPGKSIAEVIWRNKKCGIKTFKEQRKRKKRINLPHGLRVYDCTQQMDTAFVMRHFSEMFAHFKETEWYYPLGINENLFIKPNPSKETRLLRYSFSFVVKLLKQQRNMHHQITILSYYFKQIMKALNVTSKTLEHKLMDECTIEILHYHGNSGLPCHVDNISGGTGPIVTVAIGSDFYYDIRPVFFTKRELQTRHPFRIAIKNNQITVMDGEVRYAWQHCIPHGYKRAIDKYTLKLIFPPFLQKNPRHNEFFDTTFTTSS